MNIREAGENSRSRRIWRSLVEASSSATAWRRRNWNWTFDEIQCGFVYFCRGQELGNGIVGKAPIMTICTYRNSGGVNAVRWVFDLKSVLKLKSLLT